MTLQVFSFRAECPRDYEKFLKALLDAGHAVDVRIYNTELGYTDVEVEFLTDATQEEMLDVSEDIDDIHVLHETLRPCLLKNNSLKHQR